MTIGAVNAYGATSAISFRPYVYNTNMVSSVSMNKLSRISDDVLDKKIDYSGLTDESLNENPLKKGQTLDFQGMLAMQMQRGQYNAARIMRPVEEKAATELEAAARKPAGSDAAVSFDFSGAAAVDRAEEVPTEADAGAGVGSGNINYQMQQALQAYEMFMTA